MLTPGVTMGAGTWIAAGWRVYRENWGRMMLGALALVGFYLLLVAIGGGISYILGPLWVPKVEGELPPWAIAMLVILNFTVGIMLYLGFNYYALQLVRGRPPSIVQDLLYPFRRPLAVIGVTILYALAVMGGLALLVVPGIILAVRFYFADIALIDGDLGVTESLRESSEITRGYRPRIFLVLLFFVVAQLLLDLIGTAMGGYGRVLTELFDLLVLTPWEAASLMCAYDALSRRASTEVSPIERTGEV